MSTDTKTTLLNSAERAARNLGFNGFSYADLAEDVGIRKASIHHHFPSKAKLSVELMRRYHTTHEAACEDISESISLGGARMLALINLYRQGLNGGKSLCLCVSFSTTRENLPPEVIQQISAFRTMILDWLEMTFKAGQADGSISGVSSPKTEAAAALALLEGGQLAARAEENPDLFDNSIQLLIQRITV